MHFYTWLSEKFTNSNIPFDLIYPYTHSYRIYSSLFANMFTNKKLTLYFTN